MAGKKKVENSGKINSEEIKQNTSSVQGANATGDVSSSNPVASQVDDASNTEVRISKIRKEDGTVVIKKTIVKKVVKAKPADGAEAVEDNSREQQEEVKVQKDGKDTTAQNSTDAVKVPDDKDGAGLEDVTKEDSKSEDKSDEVSSEKSAEKTSDNDSKT
ncbi:MAG: hypothetical protein K2I78_00210, partial [Clostridia bacterium]|nr:hypothetical protein [Clostridia bacterium]